jgi:type I restriction enzyme R subunit
MGGAEPTPEQAAQAADALMETAARLLADNPRLRTQLVAIQQRSEQMIDVVTVDVLREAGYSQDASERARQTVDSFRHFIETHKDEITALQLLYSRPYGQRALTYRHVEELAKMLEQPPRSWTTERLWQAYAQLERDKVRGANTRRILSDVISLVRHALQMDDELVPYAERVQGRYRQWLSDQAATGRTFTPEQRWWLDKIAEQIGVNLSIQPEDFDYGEFFDRGGRLGAMRALGQDWLGLMQRLNETLAG